MRERAKKQEVIKMRVAHLDDRVEEIGLYDPNTNVFVYKQSKRKNYRRDFGAWALDLKVLDVLVAKRAKIVLKETDLKWQYECEAVDFKYYGNVLEREGMRDLFILPIRYWEITKVTQKSMIVECLEQDCKYNFANQCIRGTIKLNNKGECTGYVDKEY